MWERKVVSKNATGEDVLSWMVRLFRGRNKTTSKNREEHGALALGGRHLAATHNNQPIVGGSGRGDDGEEARGG